MDEFTVHDAQDAGPATHALVIGIGSYPYLLGGEHEIQDPDGMGQLSSPPISARAFATWLLARYNMPSKPLRSLYLLLSEEPEQPFVHPVTGAQTDVQSAGTSNIVAAVKAWKNRGDSDDDNRLIFYFCGHGVSQGDDMSLLAGEVFADEDNPLNDALDFRKLMNGLKRCRASEQVFFVDACRANSDVLIERSGGSAGQAPLGGEKRPPDFKRRLHVPYYATLAGARSHGRPGHVSLFTEALLKGLRGAGSDDPEGDWRVTTSRLQEAIDHFMKQPVFAGNAVGVQVPTVTEMPVFDFHYLTTDPMVPVYVGCEPASDNQYAEFVCRRAGAVQRQRPLADVIPDDPNCEWALDLEFGNYDFEAHVGAGPLRSKSLTIRPTYRRVRLGP